MSKIFKEYLKEQLDDLIDNDKTNVFEITPDSKNSTEADYYLNKGDEFLKIFMQDPINISKQKMKFDSIKSLLEEEKVKTVFVSGFGIENDYFENGKMEIDDFIFKLSKHMNSKVSN